MMNRAYKAEWQRNNRRDFKAKHGFSTTSNYGTGKKRKEILERDNYSCVQCGMTDEQHKEKWGRPITIDHKDKNRKNNGPENLQTLCLTCHGAKDQLPQLRVKKGPDYKLEIMTMRNSGWTYQRIATALDMSIATVWIWAKKWEKEATNGK